MQDMASLEVEFKRQKDELEEQRFLVQNYENLDVQLRNCKAKLSKFSFFNECYVKSIRDMFFVKELPVDGSSLLFLLVV